MTSTQALLPFAAVAPLVATVLKSWAPPAHQDADRAVEARVPVPGRQPVHVPAMPAMTMRSPGEDSPRRPVPIATSTASAAQPTREDALVDELVKAILADQKLNIPGLPDQLESRLYRATIGITYRLLLKGFQALDGISVLGHAINVDEIASKCTTADIVGQMKPDAINMKPLERMVDALLEAAPINQAFIPDSLERQLYLNCLVIIFQVLQAFARSVSIDLVGHKLALDLKPCEAALDSVTESIKEGGNGSVLFLADDALLERLVDDHLDSGGNVEWVPDFIERAIIKNLYTLIVHLLGNLLPEIEATLITQRFGLRLRPNADAATPTPGSSPPPTERPAPAAAAASSTSMLGLSRKEAFTAGGLAFVIVGLMKLIEGRK